MKKFAIGSWQLAICTAVAFFANCKLQTAHAQGLHFSQYYNAPMLLNPANTGLMAEYDYRAGANYRNQWASVPVPYRTISGYADFQLFRGVNMSNWLGIGVAFFNDVAGNGDLSLSRTEVAAAYHLETGPSSMLSVGLSGSWSQRSVDFTKLTFDAQWDGFSFNGTMPNGEKNTVIKTSFADVNAGINYAYFPNEAVYIKIGAGLAHINQPSESFYGTTNRLGIRPTANVDALLVLDKAVTVNPSLYYSREKNASELVYGSLFIIPLSQEHGDEAGDNLILGVFHRWNEAIVAAAGFEWGGMRVMASYDVTISKLAPYNSRQGAMELGVRWQGMYSNGGGQRRVTNCPRF